MRDVMRRSKQGGGKVTRYASKVLPDGTVALVQQGEPKAHKRVALARHAGAYGDVTEGCACAECKAAGMAAAPAPESRATLRNHAANELKRLEDKAMAAISDAKWAMTATLLRRRSNGTYGVIRRKHNNRSLKLKRAALRAVETFKKAQAMHAMTQ